VREGPSKVNDETDVMTVSKAATTFVTFSRSGFSFNVIPAFSSDLMIGGIYCCFTAIVIIGMLVTG
jgi:hypothetical protein